MERNDIIKALGECKRHTDCSNCPYYPTIRLDIDLYCREELHKDALTLIKQLIDENESLGIENEVQRLNLGNVRDDLNNAECDVARLKRENTALEREVERLKKADVVPRSEVEELKKIYRTYNKAIKYERQEVVKEIFEELKKAGIDKYRYPIIADLKKKYIGE